MHRCTRTLCSLFLIWCLLLPAVTPIYASPIDIINEILGRKSDTKITNSLILNALNKNK